MTVLAAIDNSAAARPVVAAASALTELFGGGLELVHVRTDGIRTVSAVADEAGATLDVLDGEVEARLIEFSARDDVAAIVVGTRGAEIGTHPAGHVALTLATAVRKPLIVVPPQLRLPYRVKCVLVALNGAPDTAEALEETLRLACARGLDVVVLHVHEPRRLPLFTDQPHHELEAWAEEFVRRHCPHPDRTHVEIRSGTTAAHLHDAAASAKADIVALAWSQRLIPGRAAVVRDALARSDIPILLLPVLDRSRHLVQPHARAGDRRQL